MDTANAPTGLEEAALRELEGRFRGEVVRPGDGAYDEQRRVWNGSIDREAYGAENTTASRR